MRRAPPLLPALGFALPTLVAAWIVFGVDARAAPPALRPPWATTMSAFRANAATTRHCAPVYPGDLLCECAPEVEVVVSRYHLRAAIHVGWGSLDTPAVPPLWVPRSGDGWSALARWLEAARTDPRLDGQDGFRVHADQVAYRDIIRTFELAARAGFHDARLIPAFAAEHTRPLDPTEPAPGSIDALRGRAAPAPPVDTRVTWSHW